ncbi:MAG: hypothetical protein HUU46_00040 [Candidatus Hydrogenedentes bacterium]|nr:hypothetical protein [Candidatus Hydrogenedentota bacterium]
MRIEFSETFSVPVEEAFSYFPTPPDWVRLFGFAAEVEHRGDGWYSVPLKRFPIPLTARVDETIPNRRVHWVFRGFWRGEGEVNFSPTADGVTISGFEEIRVPWMLGIGPWVERNYLQRPFERLWESGWRRLRRRGDANAEHASTDASLKLAGDQRT